VRRRGLEPPPGYPGLGPQPGNRGVRSVRLAPERPSRPAARTIWTHRSGWMLPRMLSVRRPLGGLGTRMKQMGQAGQTDRAVVTRAFVFPAILVVRSSVDSIAASCTLRSGRSTDPLGTSTPPAVGAQTRPWTRHGAPSGRWGSMIGISSGDWETAACLLTHPASAARERADTARGVPHDRQHGAVLARRRAGPRLSRRAVESSSHPGRSVSALRSQQRVGGPRRAGRGRPPRAARARARPSQLRGRRLWMPAFRRAGGFA
jgi:hypothetical protein